MEVPAHSFPLPQLVVQKVLAAPPPTALVVVVVLPDREEERARQVLILARAPLEPPLRPAAAAAALVAMKETITLSSLVEPDQGWVARVDKAGRETLAPLPAERAPRRVVVVVVVLAAPAAPAAPAQPANASSPPIDGRPVPLSSLAASAAIRRALGMEAAWRRRLRLRALHDSPTARSTGTPNQ
jgi:hypothetical protein